MIVKIPSTKIFIKDYSWHSGRFHFAFGDYQDPCNQRFGVLTALNDFIVQPESGFETHPHSEMEIISYCVHGSLTHKDDLGEKSILTIGDSQYTCTGSGITHSEMNHDKSEALRFLQIWIEPMEKGLQPLYKIKKNLPSRGNGHFQHLVSGEKIEGVMQIAQDANVFTAILKRDRPIEYKNTPDRQSYICCLEGGLLANNLAIDAYDAMKVWGNESFLFSTDEHAHMLIVEMAVE